MAARRGWSVLLVALSVAMLAAGTAPASTEGPGASPAVGPVAEAHAGGDLTAAAAGGAGYWMVGAAGDVYAFGDAGYHGAPAIGTLVTDLEPTPTGDGYWILEADGTVHARGDATDLGRAGLGAGERSTGLSATPSGEGYWVFTTLGRVVAFGDADHLGDMSGVPLNGPVIDAIATPSGRGYYMVGTDGGIFSFGDARFHGSMGGVPLNGPVVGLSPTPTGAGYWLVADDGGIFAFGDAPFRGSMGGIPLNRPVNGMVPYGDGYLMVASDGGIFAFSDQPFLGSLGADPPAVPIVGVAPLPTPRAIGIAHTWVNADADSDLLWLSEFEANDVGAERLVWFGRRTGPGGRALAPRRAELHLGGGPPVVVNLTSDGTELHSVVGSDGTEYVFLEQRSGGRGEFLVVEPDGSRHRVLVDEVPVATPAAVPASGAMTATAGHLPDRWPIRAAPLVLDVRQQPLPVDAALDLDSTRGRVTCTSDRGDAVTCSGFYDPASGRLVTVPRLTIDVPATAQYVTRESCEFWQTVWRVEKHAIGLIVGVLTGGLSVPFVAAAALGIGTSEALQFLDEDCDSGELVVDTSGGVSGQLQDAWEDLVHGRPVVLDVEACFDSPGLYFDPRCVQRTVVLDEARLESGLDLGDEELLVAEHVPLEVELDVAPRRTWTGQPVHATVQVRGGLPSVMPGDHSYDIALSWGSDATETVTRRYGDDWIGVRTGSSFGNHAFTRVGRHVVTALVTHRDPQGPTWDAVTVPVEVGPPPPLECQTPEGGTACPDGTAPTVQRGSGEWAIYRIRERRRVGLAGMCNTPGDTRIPYEIEAGETWYVGTLPWLDGYRDTAAAVVPGQWGIFVCTPSVTDEYTVTVLAEGVSERWAIQRFAQLAERLEARGYTEQWNRFFPNHWSIALGGDGQTGTITVGEIVATFP